MEPEDIDYFGSLKRDEKRCAIPSLIKNLEERSLGHLKKNVTSKEYRELVAEELLIEKEKYDELHCEMPGSPRSTFLMVFSPDGTKVASTHGNHNIYVTDIRSGKNMKTLIGHPRTPWCIAFHPTSNQIVASGCLGGQVRIWDLSGGSEVWTAANQTVIASIAFHPFERMIVIATANELYFWDWSRPRPFIHTSTGSHKEKVRYVAFDKLGHRLFTGISNSHSRWEYVRSGADRAYDYPIRHFSHQSRRPILRRGLFPPRQNISLSTSTNAPREAQSRVPERERNITISYRNLVRQYGRLVQRYLQLYRPPAMIDRGTDPMENNFAPPSSNTVLQESNVSNNTTSEMREPNSSNDTTEIHEPNSSNNNTETQEPSTSNDTMAMQEPCCSQSLITPPSSPIQSQASTSHQSDNDYTGPTRTSLARKHKNDTPENHIPKKKHKKSIDDSGDCSASNSNSPQPGTSGLSNRPIAENSSAVFSPEASNSPKCSERIDNNNTEINQLSCAQTNLLETENQESNEPTRELIENTTENNVLSQESNINTEDPIDSSIGNVGTSRESNTQTENLREDPWLNSSDARREDTGLRPDWERIAACGTTAPQAEDDESNQWNNDSVPGTSGVSRGNREQGEDQRLENMMMDMRRNAEDNLRARFMPLINSRVPENDREELIRLFEESVRESREKARLRYRNMGHTMNRQPNQRPFVIDSSDSSTSEDERDSLHMNFYIRSRTDNNSMLTENLSGTSSSTQRSRGSGISSGNNSYQNINNLESWVTSLFNDVDSSSANTHEMSTNTAQTDTRPSSVIINSLLDRPPRISCNPRRRNNNRVYYRCNRSSLPDSSQRPMPSIPSPRNRTSFRYRETNRAAPLPSGLRPLVNNTASNNFPRDEVINFAEFPNSEDDPFLLPERIEPLSGSDSFHPFNPPPNLPAINPENIGIGNMYSNIVQDLETSLNNARDNRTVDRPGEMSNMLSTFSNRLEMLMNQSEGILRNLRTSVEVLPDNDPMEYAEEAPIPTATFNDSTFFLRDQRTEGNSSGRSMNSSLGYDIRQNNATSDHTYPRNSETAGSSSNLNETMSPLMNSLHMTLSHIQSQSRLLHRQVECIERIDRAMVEVAQLQLMRLLLVELSTYVRNLSGESRSTSMSSVRQMMAGTRISDSSPHSNQNIRDDDGPIYDPGPSTSSGSRSTNNSSAPRSHGVTRKTYPPSRLNRPRDSGYSRNTRSSQDQSSSAEFPHLPSVAPPHTFSEINVGTLVRMDRRLQSLIDDHSMRFSYLHENYAASSSRRLFHEVGEHTLALRLRESITRTNRLLGNIFNANVVRNYRIDSSTSLRHGIERYYERTLLSLIIDGLSSHLDQNRTTTITADIRTRMQNVLQLAMVMSDILLLHTINSLTPTTDVNIDVERNILANRISETCTTMIQCRQYRNFSNIFVQSLRNLRLIVSSFGSTRHARLLTQHRRGYVHPLNLTSNSRRSIIVRNLDEINNTFENEQTPLRGFDGILHTEEYVDNTGRVSNDIVARESMDTTSTTSETRGRESSNTRFRQSIDTRNRESNETRAGGSGETTNNSPLINACLYLARRQRAQDPLNSNSNQREALTLHLRNILRENRTRTPITNTVLSYLRERQQESSISTQSSDTNAQQNEDSGNGRVRRRNSTDHLINAYLTAGRNGTQNQSESNQSLETNSQRNESRNASTETGMNRSSSFNPFRDMALITSFGRGSRSTQNNREESNQNDNPQNRSSSYRPTERTHMFSALLPSLRNQHTNNAFQTSEPEVSLRFERDPTEQPQRLEPNSDINAWWERAVGNTGTESSEDNSRLDISNIEFPAFSPLGPRISPIESQPSTSNNTSPTTEPRRHWSIPSVQVNDIPVVDLGAVLDSSESDNSPTPATQNNNNSSFPRMMARFAALRSVSVYNPIGVLRPRLLHPLYATLNPFDADLEQREHIYDTDVISTVTPNHRIQVWDITESIIPDICDPIKNLVVRECKIHNDASVDIASDGSILVTLLPSGGYLNITNRLGVYSLRGDNLGQCLYTTSFVHNAVSVSLSPLGRHLVVGLASRRVSLLPNDRWMMASIFKIEEKDTPGDHLPFVRQIDRGTDERATSHKSVNCIRWLPTSGQGLIYATNTGQLNIWT